MDLDQGLDGKSFISQSDAMESKISQKKSVPLDLRAVKSELDQVTTHISEYEGFLHDKLDVQLGKSDSHERMARNLFAMQAAIGLASLVIAIALSVWMAHNPNSSKDLGARGELDLKYLNARGRAEIIRLVLSAGAVRFHEKKGAEPDKDLVDVTLPEIKHGLFSVSGTWACAEYVADLGLNERIFPSPQQRALDSKLVGIHNKLIDKLLVDPESAEFEKTGAEICAILTQVEELYQETRDQATGVKAEELERRKNKPNENIENWLNVERTKHLTGNKGTYLYANEIPSLGDLAIFAVLTMGPPAWHSPELHTCFDLQKWPRLQKMKSAVQDKTHLKAYFRRKEKRWEQTEQSEQAPQE